MDLAATVVNCVADSFQMDLFKEQKFDTRDELLEN